MLYSLFLCAGILAPALSLPHDQIPLLAEDLTIDKAYRHRQLQGRFLHITDFHPDAFYKAHSSPDEACHHGHGSAGLLGAESTDCDSPFALVNATFQWLSDNLKDSVDFVVWTGDSARHDSDDRIPRKESEIMSLNEFMVAKFREVWGKGHKKHDPNPNDVFEIPIIPTFGNNDIMPHNILESGPNFWTRKYATIWEDMIPEEQRHSFQRGGWFYVEAIPNRLAVFNLNTMYFFNHNSAVDGCAKKSEPGRDQMEWLRIQLQLLRERGVKAIMTGHVPPARTDNKQAWDSTCWQMYSLWMKQYRDVVVGSLYGHMNIDHFMLQNFHDIKKKTKKGRLTNVDRVHGKDLGDEISVQSSREYLSDLREDWARIPDAPKALEAGPLGDWRDCWNKIMLKKKKHRSKTDKYLKKIGGQWAEQYAVSLVTASVVPNYFPSFRVIEYNTTGLDDSSLQKADGIVADLSHQTADDNILDEQIIVAADLNPDKKHKKKKKKPHYTIPSPPSTSSAPGPAYSPQPLTWLRYKQYYANLTTINAALEASSSGPKWEDFQFELEYDTGDDSIFSLPDLTVRSWVDLARRIGKYQPEDVLELEADGDANDTEQTDNGDFTERKSEEKTKKKKKKSKYEKRKAAKLWFTFLRRAYVGAKGDDELREEFAGL